MRVDESEKFGEEENGKEKEMQHQPYDLPADAESIRTNIIDSQFSCDEKDPGYYADVENECQVSLFLSKNVHHSLIFPLRFSIDASKVEVKFSHLYVLRKHFLIREYWCAFGRINTISIVLSQQSTFKSQIELLWETSQLKRV